MRLSLVAAAWLLVGASDVLAGRAAVRGGGGMGEICREQFEAAVQDPATRLRERLGLSSAEFSDWIETLNALRLPDHGGIVVYGSRSHHLWFGLKDLDVKMLLPRDHFGPVPPVQISQASTRRLQEFSERRRIAIDPAVFGYWGNRSLSSLIYHGVLPDAHAELRFVEDLEEVWSKVLEYGILWDRMHELQGAGQNAQGVGEVRRRLRTLAESLEDEPLFRHARTVRLFPDHPFVLTDPQERAAFRDPIMEMAARYGLSPRAALVPFLTLDIVFILTSENEGQVEPLRRLGYRHVYLASEVGYRP